MCKFPGCDCSLCSRYHEFLACKHFKNKSRYHCFSIGCEKYTTTPLSAVRRKWTQFNAWWKQRMYKIQVRAYLMRGYWTDHIVQGR